VRRGEAIRLIKAAARNRSLIFSGHALEEMDADQETIESVSAAIERATAFERQLDDSWKVRGEHVAAVVDVKAPGVVVVTVWIG
jgi:hypothetical protein